MSESIVDRLHTFMDNEAKSCSMDFGCITSLYVYRMWGSAEPIEEIERALIYLKANNYGY